MYSLVDSVARKMLPPWLYHRLIGNWNQEGFKKYFHNTSWMFFARAFTFLTSFLMVAIVARYLGPENLGKLSYAQSFVAILSVFATLGIDQILFRELARRPHEQGKILGTAIYAKTGFGFLAFVVSVLTSFLLGNEPLLTILIGLIAFNFLVTPVGTIGLFFQAKALSKYNSLAAIYISIFVPLAKLLVIYFDKGIIYFAFLLTVEAIVISLWMLIIYIKKFGHSPRDLTFNKVIFYELIKDGWPFLFATLFVYIYARIDQVMLQHYLGPTAVGLYDSAVRLTNMWSFIPALVITALFPAIINARGTDRAEYLRRYKALNLLVLGISLCFVIPITIFAKPIVDIIFGPQFAATTLILQIYVWSGLLATWGTVEQHFLLAENKGRLQFVFTLGGAVLNISLNMVLIPLYGMLGAVLSTLLSYAVLPVGVFVYRHVTFNTKKPLNKTEE